MRRVRDQRKPPTQASRSEALAPPEATRIADQLAIHSPPQHGRGFNLAEIARSPLRRPGRGGRSAAQAPLANKGQAWNPQRHETHAKAHGPLTTEDARGKLRRLYLIVST